MAIAEQEAKPGGLKGIAKLAGVSPATVSRVINNRPGVRAELRRAVEEAIREHGLELNVAARALKTRRTRTLAIIIPRAGYFVFANPFFTEVFRGMSLVTEQAGYSLIVTTGATPQTLYEVNRNRSCDAVVFIGFRKNIPEPKSLKGATVPVVTIPQPGPRYRLPCLAVDDEAGAYEATSYLIGRGHQRIGVVGGTPSSVFTVNRLAGYRQALKDADIAYSPSLAGNGDFTEEGAMRPPVAFWIFRNPPSAIFALSDFMGTGAFRAIRDRGLKIPHDVALLSFGNSPICSLLSPSLTAVDEQMLELGKQAATMLIRLAEGEEVPNTQIVVPTKLIVRESA